jgi:hypothetical protein
LADGLLICKNNPIHICNRHYFCQCAGWFLSVCCVHWSVCCVHWSVFCVHWPVCCVHWSVCCVHWSVCCINWSVCSVHWSVWCTLVGRGPVRSSPPLHPHLPPHQVGGIGEGKMFNSSCTCRPSQPATPPPPPSASTTWAEVARGGSSRGVGTSSDQTRAKPPAAYSSSNNSSARPIITYADTSSAPLPLPSAHTQYLAWVACRRDGVPARLVLETDGATEEVSLWFGSAAAADVATHAPTSGKR